MKRLSTIALVLALLIVATGCADQALAPSSDDASVAMQTHAADPPDPFEVLSRAHRGAPSSAKSGAATFGLIQGLAPAPNGDIMVADLVAGIGSRTHGIEIDLPGVTDAKPIGRGTLWATVGPVGDGDDCITGETTFFECGQGLYRASKGKTRLIANLFAFEDEHNPDGAFGLAKDSNPYDIMPISGRAALVVDAAGNDLLRVDNRGRVDALAVFPPGDPVSIAPEVELAPEAVPTSMAVGSDGYYYVGELTGFPATPDASSIWKVAPDADNPVCPSPDCTKAFDGGFTSIIDLAVGPDGYLYVAELDESTWLAFTPGGPAPTGGTINKCDLDTKTCSVVADKLFFLNAITFGSDGTLWATSDFAASVEAIPTP
jgi:hypothetical protein